MSTHCKKIGLRKIRKAEMNLCPNDRAKDKPNDHTSAFNSEIFFLSFSELKSGNSIVIKNIFK